MCGILYAKVKRQHNDIEFSNIFNDALKLMEYRGPDHTASIKYGKHYFGHVRLSILDLSHNSDQPLENDQYIMLFNGEVYNFRNFSSQYKSDSLMLINETTKDKDVLNKIEGMYAIVLFEKETEKITINRDYFGEKPLYYFNDENIFIVSSTLKSITYILQNYFKQILTLDKYSICNYLLFGYIKEPRTIFKEIQILNSNFILNYDSTNKLSITKKPNLNKSTSEKEYYKNTFSARDVSATLLLSAGVDSTYILHQLIVNNLAFHTLTYESENPLKDESKKALENFHKIANNSKSIKPYVVTGSPDIKLYQEFIQILEQPTSDGLNLFNILNENSKMGKQDKVIFTGLGGDELFGGYNSFKYYKLYNLINKIPFLEKFIHGKFHRFFKLKSHKKTDKNVELYYWLYRVDSKVLMLLEENLLDDLFNEFFLEMKKYESTKTDYLSRIRKCETFDYMKNQLLRDSDNISMYFGVEARSPLLNEKNYNSRIDYKKGMQKELYEQYHIEFPHKKGFTLDNNPENISFFLENIIRINNQYNIFSEKFIDDVTRERNLSIYKKIYILLQWLEYNQPINIKSHIL